MNGEAKEKERNNFISIGEASKLSGLNVQTLRKMVDLSQIKSYRTPSGQRRIDQHDLQKMCNNFVYDETKLKGERQNFLYSRVSTKKQLDDLSRQAEYLRQPGYESYILIKDIGSGINFKRKGIQTILDACIQGNIGEVVVAHRDRLCRFAFDLIQAFVEKAGGKITVLDNEEGMSENKELADDLMAIIHIFNCRQMERRSYSRKIKNDENTDLSN
jgi:putative resolvase